MSKVDSSVGIIISKDGSLCWSQADDPSIPDDAAWRIEYMNYNPYPDPEGLTVKDIRWIWRFAGSGFEKRVNEIYAHPLRCCEVIYADRPPADTARCVAPSQQAKAEICTARTLRLVSPLLIRQRLFPEFIDHVGVSLPGFLCGVTAQLP